MRETWYVLTDGAVVCPNEVAPDAHGRLLHQSGIHVQVGPHGPISISVGPDDIAAAVAARRDAKPTKGKGPRKVCADMAGKYETR